MTRLWPFDTIRIADPLLLSSARQGTVHKLYLWAAAVWHTAGRCKLRHVQD